VIATLAGRLRRKLEDRVILECGGLGYEVFLPPIAVRQIEHVTAGPGEKGSELELVVYYHATRDQPRPVLIGFTSDLDKEFFEKLITVKDIGPMVAARALALPVAELAQAIARQDEKFLRGLPASARRRPRTSSRSSRASRQVRPGPRRRRRRADRRRPGPRRRRRPARAGVGDHGQATRHRPSEASQLITDALRRRPSIMSPEELFDEIYRGEKK